MLGLFPAAAELKKLFCVGKKQKILEDAAWQTWINLGYGLTGSSPQLSSRLQYFLEGHDEAIMNRDRLLTRAIELVGEMQNNYIAPTPQ